MNENSRKWTTSDAAIGLRSEVAAMAQGGFRLIGAAALMYVSGVYWEPTKMKAADVAEMVHEALAQLNYGKSSRYQLATAGLRVARNLTRKWGQPDAAANLNVAWQALRDAESFAQACDFMVSQIKADYQVETLRDLYAALAGRGEQRRGEKTLADQFLHAIKRSGADADRIAEAVLATIDQHLGVDHINALVLALSNRISASGQRAA